MLANDIRNGIGLSTNKQKFGQLVSQRHLEHHFSWGNTGTNGAQPGSEAEPH